MLYQLAIVAVASLAGGIASVTGFGIGSLLTPLVAAGFGMKTAVGAVSIPHFLATALRFVRLRGQLDRRVLRGFGLMNAGGAQVGALIHVYVSSRTLTTVLAVLLMFAGAAALSGLANKFRFRGPLTWIAGALSGGFGGLVGNQGGIRSAALLGFDLASASCAVSPRSCSVNWQQPCYWLSASSCWRFRRRNRRHTKYPATSTTTQIAIHFR